MKLIFNDDHRKTKSTDQETAFASWSLAMDRFHLKSTDFDKKLPSPSSSSTTDHKRRNRRVSGRREWVALFVNYAKSISVDWIYPWRVLSWRKRPKSIDIVFPFTKHSRRTIPSSVLCFAAARTLGRVPKRRPTTTNTTNNSYQVIGSISSGVLVSFIQQHPAAVDELQTKDLCFVQSTQTGRGRGGLIKHWKRHLFAR